MKPKSVTASQLESLKPTYLDQGYPIPKWIKFCEAMLEEGFAVSLYRAKDTFSKYVFVEHADQRIKVRFSNHKPAYDKQSEDDCDYYVGVSHSGVVTTEEVIEDVTIKLRKAEEDS